MKIRHDLAEKGEDETWRMLMIPDWRLEGWGGHLHIIDHVGRWYGRYPEGLMKIQHDMAEKKLFPGGGWSGGWVGFS